MQSSRTLSLGTRNRLAVLLLAALPLAGCAGFRHFFREQPNTPYRPYTTPYTVPAPETALKRRPDVIEPPPAKTEMYTVGENKTVMVGKHPLTKVDEFGDPFTITAYQPQYFHDDEEYTDYVDCDVYVVDPEKLARAIDKPKSGTTICIGDGEYKDLDLSFVGYGSYDYPITLSARHPGKVVLSGRTHIAMAGMYLVLRGLRIESASSKEARLIELRAKVAQGFMACSNCRVSEVVIRNVDRDSKDATAWISLFGQENRVDHSVLTDKKNPGPMLELWRPGDQPDNTLVDHNLFARRAPVKRDGEALRLGSAAEQRSDSFTVVQDNLFEDLHGGPEYVSSQSSAVAFMGNTFRRCTGMLTLRHGDGDVVESNLFFAEHVPDAGGIRVIDGHHRVVSNYIEGVRTRRNDTGGIVLMSYDKGYTEAGYQSVIHVLVGHNTIIDSEQSLVLGGGKNRMPPKWVTLANNLVAFPYRRAIHQVVGMKDWDIEGNAIHGGQLGLEGRRTGFWKLDPKLYRDYDGLARPSDESEIIGMVEQAVDSDFDMDMQARSPRPDIGADETINASGPERSPLTAQDVGPKTYTLDR